jgi:hypothetical protein
VEELFRRNCPIHKTAVEFSPNYHIGYSISILRLVVRIFDYPYGRHGHTRRRGNLVAGEMDGSGRGYP